MGAAILSFIYTKNNDVLLYMCLRHHYMAGEYPRTGDVLAAIEKGRQIYIRVLNPGQQEDNMAAAMNCVVYISRI